MPDPRRWRTSDVIIGGWLIAVGIAAIVLVRQMNPGWGSPWDSRSVPRDESRRPYDTQSRAVEDWPADTEVGAPTPDGTAVLFVRRRNGLESLRLTALDLSRDRDLTSPAPIRYRSLTYSPDGRWIYAVTSAADEDRASLQLQPAGGGAADTILTDVVGSPALSPDGMRLAYFVNRDGRGTLQIADARARDPREMLSRDAPFTHDAAVAWSPNGTLLVAPAADDRSLQVIDIATGEVRGHYFDGLTQFCGVAWSRSNTIIACAARPEASPRRGVFAIDYPADTLREVSWDESGQHYGVWLSADGGVLLSAARAFRGAREMHTVGKPMQRSTESLNDPAQLPRDPSWKSDGTLVVARQSHVFTYAPGGINVWQATGGPTEDRQPVYTADGRYLVFETNANGERVLWRADSTDAKILELHGDTPQNDPIISTDNRQVYWADDEQQVWRVSIDGGNAELVHAAASGPPPAEGMWLASAWPKISPDGEWVARAAIATPDARYGHLELVRVVGSGGRRFTGEIDTALWHTAAWSADGRSFFHAHQREAPRPAGGFGTQYTGKVWALDVTSGAARVLTEFSDGPLTDMAVSRDLSRVVLIRGGPVLSLLVIRE